MTHREEHPELYPISLPLDTKSFVAKGTRYFVNSNVLLSPNRLKYVSDFALALSYQRNPIKYIKDIQSLDTPINLHDKETINRTLERMIKALETVERLNYSTDCYICALFINREDEDVNEFDLADAALKVADWSGHEITPFRQWANEFLARLNN